MLIEYRVVDKKGNVYMMYAHGEHSQNGVDKLGIRDKVINTLDMSLEPFSITTTGQFKHEDDNRPVFTNQE